MQANWEYVFKPIPHEATGAKGLRLRYCGLTLKVELVLIQGLCSRQVEAKWGLPKLRYFFGGSLE